MAKSCPECGSPMNRFITGWKCMNVKAHAAARRRRAGPPKGHSRWMKRTPPRPKGKGLWVLTDCPNCENGRRRNPARCPMCDTYGKIWTIEN